MIVTQNSSGAVVTSSGIAEGRELSIKASGKAFKSMIDSIYRDKPGSIVRELSANALDAQTVAGNADRPFILHLPDAFEPYFAIRDFGCSMSPEQINNVYSVLFESSKDGSNDQVGGFGLGGKNFLAYQDSGTIVAYLDGVKYNYVLMYNDQGKPVVHPFGTEPTEEENGIYVEVAVRENDFHIFRDAVKTQLRWLKVKPILENNSAGITIDTPEFDQTFGNFSTLKQGFGKLNGFWAIQGQIGYPVNLKEVSAHIKNRTALEFFNAFSGGVMNFDIGDILVTLSREDIQYDRHTIQSIENFIATVAPIMAEGITEKIDSFPSIWEKMRYLNSNPSLFRIAKLAGVEIKDALTKFYSGNNKWQIDASFLSQTGSTYALSQFHNGKRKYFGSNGMHIDPSQTVHFIIRDEVKNAVARLKWFDHTRTAYDKIYLIEHREGSEKVNDAVIKDIESRLGGIKVIRASELDDPPKNSSVGRGTPVVYRWDGKQGFDKINKWTKVYDEDEIENGYYITFDNYPHIFMDQNQQEILVKAAQGKAIDKNTPIYAIKEKKASLFTENVNFRPIGEIAKKVYADAYAKFSNLSFIKRFALAEKLHNETAIAMDRLRLNKINADELRRLINKNNALAKIVRLHTLSGNIIENLKNTYMKDIDTKGLAGILFREVCAKERANMANKTIDIEDCSVLLEKYPQLNWLSSAYGTYSPKLSKQVVDYIEFMDTYLTSKEA